MVLYCIVLYCILLYVMVLYVFFFLTGAIRLRLMVGHQSSAKASIVYCGYIFYNTSFKHSMPSFILTSLHVPTVEQAKVLMAQRRDDDVAFDDDFFLLSFVAKDFLLLDCSPANRIKAPNLSNNSTIFFLSSGLTKSNPLLSWFLKT
jgi:hypothetical protein